MNEKDIATMRRTEDDSCRAYCLRGRRLQEGDLRCLLWCTCILVLATTGCSDTHGPEAATASSGQPFVTFREDAIHVEALEVPTALPVTVGSSPSAELLSSSDPAIASVDTGGNVIAHRNGEVAIRGSTGGTLRVIVNAVGSLQILPSRLELAPASRATVRVLDDGGREVAEKALHWETTFPNVGAASGMTVRSGLQPGAATLTVRSGAAHADLALVVTAPQRTALRISAISNKLRVGATTRFQVEGAQQLPAQWTTSDAKVLEPLQQGIYYARRRGSAKACAIVAGRQACQIVQVTR